MPTPPSMTPFLPDVPVRWIPLPNPKYLKDLDLSPLRDYIQTYILRWSQHFTTHALYETNSKRPYWKKRMQDELYKGNFLLKFAKPMSLDTILRNAEAHFKSNPRCRSYNVIFKNIYLGSLLGTKAKRRYFYYLSLRIQKKRLYIKENGYYDKKRYRRVLMATIDKLCPWGQIIHYSIEKKDKKIADFIEIL